ALGSNYWKEQGVPVIAHADAAAEIEEGAHALLTSMQRYNRDKAEGTEVVLPDITFEEEYVIELGGMRIEALYLGPGHSPGDIQVWLPQQKLVISGDMAFHQRMLPIFDNTDTRAWLETYDRFLALEPEVVIPGHGVPTDMDEVTKYTRDYLIFLRAEVQRLLDEGGTLADAYEIDQSAYSDLDTYDELAARNAGMVFEAMEFE
ncbi:MAG: MBL fold metallo-hydrolase, partial [Gammaproteobacteria bacterium]